MTGLGQAFRKPSGSYANGQCAEAALRDGIVLVRDSKLGAASPVLELSPAAWREFMQGIKGGAGGDPALAGP